MFNKIKSRGLRRTFIIVTAPIEILGIAVYSFFAGIIAGWRNVADAWRDS